MNFRRVVLASVLTCVTAMSVPAASAVSPQHAPVQFEFHNSLLMNLHGMLLAASRKEETRQGLPWSRPLDADEQARLSRALDYYRTQFARKDALFSDELRSVKAQLAEAGDEQWQLRRLGLAPEHEQALTDILPVYRQLLWPLHQAQNRRWIAATQALNRQHGAAIQAGVTRGMGAPLPARIRFDAVAYSGHWAGAFTSSQPAHSVVETNRADYRGLMALEMIYHEASHVGTTDVIEDAILRQLPASAPRSDLWHALQFYTVGDVVKQTLRQERGIDYTPYAYTNGLFAAGRPWAVHRPGLERDWEAHLRGQISRDEAIQRLTRPAVP